jgi:hypothetical protein
VKDLEHEINSRAGEYLLIWETSSGVLTRMGFFRSVFSWVKPFPRSEFPALESSFLIDDHKRNAGAPSSTQRNEANGTA